MSKFTDFLNLFMWDSIEDSEEEFNIDKALNDNWKKIDTKVKTHVTSVNEEINNFKEETNQKIENIQALPTGGTKGQVLTKQSETEGDANWEDIEANEVFVGNEEEAPSSAKIIVEDEDFEESAGLSKAEVYVGAEEPTTGEKVWFRKGKNYLDISKLKSRTTYGITFEPTATGIKITGTAQDVYAYGGSVSVELKKGKTYMLYGNNAGNTFKLELRKGSTIITTIKTSGDKVTFTPSDNINIVTFVLEGISKGTTYNYEINNLQIEQGSKNTSYEAYIEPKLSVRNSNGVYEEFAKKSEEVYSTEEQRIGTWIDGKPLYRIIKECDVSAKETQSNDISSIPYDTIFINLGKSFNRWVDNSSASIVWNTSDNDKGNVWINYEKKLNILNSSNAARHYWITLEYTKTTD